MATSRLSAAESACAASPVGEASPAVHGGGPDDIATHLGGGGLGGQRLHRRETAYATTTAASTHGVGSPTTTAGSTLATTTAATTTAGSTLGADRDASRRLDGKVVNFASDGQDLR